MNELENNFYNIIESNNELIKIFNFIKYFNNNILLYSNNGFPLDLFINELIKKKFNISSIYKKESIWDKNITYYENKYFFEINLIDPNSCKNYELLTNFIGYLVKIKNIYNEKHLVIIKHIDFFNEQFSILKILLEKYSSNVYFICTTFKISNIENAIISRFTYFRIPQFKTHEIELIFNKILNKKFNKILSKSNCRNLIFAIFISEIEDKEPHLITEEFCNLKSPTAIRVFGLTVMCNICLKHPELSQELLPILTDFENTGTVGFENRLRKEIKRVSSLTTEH